MTNEENYVRTLYALLETRDAARSFFGDHYARYVSVWVSHLRKQGVGVADVSGLHRALAALRESQQYDAAALAISAFIEMHDNLRTPGLEMPEVRP